MKLLFLLLFLAAGTLPVTGQYAPVIPVTKPVVYHSLFSRDSLPIPFSPRLLYPQPRLGFFCRQELHFEKATHVAVHFRLGSSANYCDWMEGKSSQRFRPEP